MNLLLPPFDEQNQQQLNIVNSEDTIFAVAWNVANPSLERAKKQWLWLSDLRANILILSEIKDSQGCRYLQYQLETAGYKVFNETTSSDKYGVMVCIYGFEHEEIDLGFTYLKSRVINIEIKTFLGRILVIGIYVPSRGNKKIRNVEKKHFQSQISCFLKNNITDKIIIGGDLNVVPRNHNPYYPVFGEWEYSFYEDFVNVKLIDSFTFIKNSGDHTWFSKAGNGFRFDFLFVSKSISGNIIYSEHIHETRILKLSDHSAVSVKLIKETLSPIN